MIVLVIIVVLVVVLGMLPLIMQLAMWWSCGGTGYASTDYASGHVVVLAIIVVLVVVLGMLLLILVFRSRYWLLLWCLWWYWVCFHCLCKWPCGGIGYHRSACGGTGYAYTDNAGGQVVVLVIVMVLVVALGILPLIMHVAMWWYWLSL